MRQNRRNAPQYWPRHVNHRFNRLEDLGLIVITRAEHGRGRREPPKVAELAGARRGIERGLLYDLKEPNDEAAEDILAELRALRETDERLEQRINAMDESVSLVDNDVQTLNDWLHGYVAEFEPRLLGIRSALDGRIDDGITRD